MGAADSPTAFCEAAKIAKISKIAKCIQRLRTQNAPKDHAEILLLTMRVVARIVHGNFLFTIRLTFPAPNFLVEISA